MAIVITNDQNYTNIADAIRSKGVSGVFKPAEMSNAIASIASGGGIDALLYLTEAPRFDNRYPSENPVIYCPLVKSWSNVFYTDYRNSVPYKNITVKSDASVSSMTKAFYGYNPASSLLETVTIDADLSNCSEYATMIYNHANFKELKGTPLDFSSVTNSTYAEWIKCTSSFVPTNEIKAKYKANTLYVNQSISTVKFTDDTMVSIANGLQSGAHTITLHTDMKTKCQTIKGTVSQVTDDEVTYDFFTASASGTVTLENFITQAKGWTIA